MRPNLSPVLSASRQAFVLLLFLLCVPVPGRAQDVSTMEALIANHKGVRSRLLLQSSVEQVNESLHELSKKTVVDYDSVNVRLDKYTRCFDLIDVIYNGGRMALNVYDTADDVSSRLGELKNLLSDFLTKRTLHLDIVSSDAIIIKACDECYDAVLQEGTQLRKSIIEVAQYASGMRCITTAGLLSVFNDINTSLDNIRTSVDHAYLVIWRYVSARLHYFKGSLYRSKTLGEMANNAIERWKRVALKASGFNY